MRRHPLLVAVCAAVAGGLLLSPPGPAGAEPDSAAGTGSQPDPAELNRWAAAVLDGDAAPVRQAAALGCFSTPQGDVVDLMTGEPAPFPRADLLEYCVDNAATIEVTARTEQPTPVSTVPEGGEYFSVQWALEVNGDDMPEYLVSFELGSASVMDMRDTGFEESSICDARPSVDGSRYAVTFPSACIASPDRVRVAATVIVAPDPADPADPDGPAYLDGTELSTEVARTGPVVGTRRGMGRLAGGDRYATAVAVSRDAFPTGASTVYLARGDAFSPDALVGGSLTDGPVLLVPQCGPLPPVVAEEVRRLAARRVLALGGPAAVCDALVTAAASA